ncbi:MAG: D-sedoheptulose 7-phosphate isomerase [Alphaproteobacteria bacterium]|nr:D-sedoheptulose 7-phosphate isomerase [Alphaproteobacteria bacterium]
MSFDLDRFYTSEFAEHDTIQKATAAAVGNEFKRLVEASVICIKGGNKILFFGNGGSAADAQHLATELTVRYITNRTAIAAIALTTDTSALTAIGNDLGFDVLFSRQIEALGKPGDLALAITTSGQSPNILKALETARRMKLVTAALTGKGGGELVKRSLADIALVVPSKTTARIQEMHITLGQMLCGALEKALGYVD